MKRLLLTALLLLLFSAFDAPGQRKFGGRVVEVVDGKTVVIELNTGKMTAVLSYIEIPEPDQSLNGVVRDHLAKLVLGKAVEFHPVRLTFGRTAGKLFSGGVDISQQMIRDGAAWHEPVTTSGQEPSEAAESAQNQSLAKVEKRGVWSIEGIKPPWEVRAEKEEKLRLETAKGQGRAKLVGVNEYQTARQTGAAPGRQAASPNFEAWTDVFAGVGKESAGLATYTDPNQRFSTIYTSVAFVNLISASSKQKVECRAIYGTINLPNGQRQTMYLLGFQAISADFNFSTRKSGLTVVADKQSIALGNPRGFKGEASYGVHEVFYYKVSKASLKKIAYAKSVDIRIGSYSGVLAQDTRELIKQLVAATE